MDEFSRCISQVILRITYLYHITLFFKSKCPVNILFGFVLSCTAVIEWVRADVTCMSPSVFFYFYFVTKDFSSHSFQTSFVRSCTSKYLITCTIVVRQNRNKLSAIGLQQHFCFQILIKCFLDTFIQKMFF